MNDMSDQDALSVLQRMDLEVRQRQQERVALAKVSEIIQKYQAAQRGLESLERTRTDLEASIAGLQGRISSEESALRKPFLRERNQLQEEIVSLQAKAMDAKEATRAAEVRLVAAEHEAQAKISQLDADLKAKTEELGKLERSLDGLKKKHGFA
jgi:chromosome segregation ATPase